MAVRVKQRGGYEGGSAGQKIVEVNKKLGVGNMANQQGTTRIIYDSVLLNATTSPTQITLFQNCNTRQFPLTNLTENKFQIGETMAMERFSMFIMICSPGTTNVRNVVPLSFFQQFQMIYASQFNFNIAENQVVKQLPLTGMMANFNHHSRFIGYYQTQPTAADPVTSYQSPHDIFKFDNDIIIPQQIQFFATLTIPTIPALVSGLDAYLTCKISGLGSLFSPKGNY